MPTWVVAHSQGGQRRLNENMQNVPWLSVADAVDPASLYFEDALRNGVGTVHVMPGNNTLLGGSGMVVRPVGRTVEDMAWPRTRASRCRSHRAAAAACSRSASCARAIEDVREYLADFERRKAEFDKEKTAGAIPADKTWTEEIDRTKKAACDLCRRRRGAGSTCPRSPKVDEALRSESGARPRHRARTEHRRSGHAAAQVQEARDPRRRDRVLRDRRRDAEGTQDLHGQAAADAGVPFALTLGTSGPTSYPWWQLGTCVRNGVDRRLALEALTVVPARLLGLEDQIGSLTEGKLGNVQILTGDPLQATSWVETVLLEGAVVYERSKDPRLQYLFAEEKDKPTKAAGPAKTEPQGKPIDAKADKSEAEKPKDEKPKAEKPKDVKAGGGTEKKGEV
jgi:hypothetical protein